MAIFPLILAILLNQRKFVKWLTINWLVRNRSTMFSIRDSAILWPSYVKYSELITLSSKPLKEWLYYLRFLANSKKKKKKWTVGLVESLQKYHLNLWKYLTFYLMYKWLIENICGRKQQRFWTKRKNCISMWIVIFGPSPNLDRVMMFFLTKDKLNSNIYEKKFTINFVLNADGLEHFSGSRLFGITMTTVAASRSTTTATFRRIAVKWKIFFTLKTFAFAEGNEKCSILPRK